MKIIYYTDSLGSGGAERQLVYTALEAEIKGNKVLIVIDHPTFHYKYMLEGSNIKVICTNTNRFNPIKRFFKLKQIVKQFNPDVFHSFLSMKNLWGMFISYLEKVPIRIASIRNSNPDSFKHINLYSKWTSKIVFNSELARNIAIKRYRVPELKTITIYNGINMKSFEVDKELIKQFKRKYDLENKIVGAFIGSLGYRKNHISFFKAIAELKKINKLKNIHFLIVGSLSNKSIYDNIKEIIINEDLEQYVTILGERKDIPVILNSSDFLILPSLYEGLPNVVMEAMASKTFVIATAVGGVPELIDNGVTGLLIKSPTSADISTALETYLEMNNEQRLRIIENAYRKISNFSIDNMFNQVEDLYLSLSNPKIKRRT